MAEIAAPMSEPRRLGGGPQRAVMLAFPVVVLLVIGFAHRWIADDGFIYLRIVQHVVNGDGPVFNAGERVEAYTSPAWLATLSLAELTLPLRLEWIAVLLGLAFSSLGLLAAMAGACRLADAPEGKQSGRRTLVVPAGALVVLAPFATWIWLTSGLETSLTWAWIGASLYLLSRWAAAEGSLGRGACIILGLGWLVRPELVLLSAVFLAVLMVGEWSTASWRTRAGQIAAAVALPLAYQVFRMGYFGSLVANTAITKEGTSVAWDRGLSYLRDFVDPYWLWIPIVVIVLGGYLPLAARAGRRQRLVLAAFLLGAALMFVYVAAVGDYLHGRFCVPALFVLCAPVAAIPVQRRFLGMALLIPWAVLTFFALRPPQLDGGFMSGFTLVPQKSGLVTTDDFGWGAGGPRIAWYEGADLYIEVNPLAPGGYRPAGFATSDDLDEPAVVASAVGVVGYALGSDVYIVDTLGLAHPVGSHFMTDPNLIRVRRAGHDKPAPPAWLVAQLAAPGAEVPADMLAALGPVQSGQLIPLEQGSAFDAQVTDARFVLECETFRRLREAASADFGPRQFFRNLVRAPGNTMLRIPPDPLEARADLCAD